MDWHFRAWLRSKWHRPVSSTMMVLSFEGARSGKAYSFPVGYAESFPYPRQRAVTFTFHGWGDVTDPESRRVL